MVNNLPSWLSVFFALTTLLTVYLFYKATRQSKTSLYVLLGWLILQAIVGLSGFYTVTQTLPPRFGLLVLPPLFLIVFLFSTAKGRAFIDSLDPKWLTYLHTVRFPVELTLFWLCLHKLVPEIMTFEGRNLDILSGLTAPLVAYFGFQKRVLGKNALLIWNFVCIGLLVNIVSTAILSVDSPFQKFAFEQPNVGVMYFPFVWLPGCVVPLVLFSHLATIRHLLKTPSNK
jgi:hypothetical protein